jgi:hypothetical protein
MEFKVINKLCADFSRIIMVSMVFALCVVTNLSAKELKPLPEVDNLTIEQFEAQTEPVTRDNEIDPAVSFTLRVKPEWQEMTDDKLKNYTVDDILYGDIAEFVSPVSSLGRATLKVESQEINRLLYLKHWIIQDILKEGYSLRSIKEHEDGSVETVYVAFEDSRSYVVRSISEFNGQRILKASYSVPIELYKRYKDMQIRSIESVEFTVKDPAQAEELATYAFLDKRKFDYPESLSVQSGELVSEDKLNMRFILRDKQNYPKGNFDVVIFAKDSETTLKEEIQKLLERYEASNLIRKGLIEKKEYDVNEMFDFQSVEVYGVSLKKDDYFKYEEDPITQELWMAILGDDKFYTIVSLMGTTRDVDTISWSRNAKAFEIILGSMREGNVY